MTEKITLSKIVQNMKEPHLFDIYGAGFECGLILCVLTIWFAVRYPEYAHYLALPLGTDFDVSVVICVIILGSIAAWFHRQSFRMVKQVRVWKEDAEYHGRELNPTGIDKRE